MPKSTPPRFKLQSFRLRNFKAVRDSGVVRFQPFTLLIGNNGSGKSSLVEGLQAYWDSVRKTAATALQRWYGFEHVYSHRAPAPTAEKPAKIGFVLKGRLGKGAFSSDLDLAAPAHMDFVVRAYDKWQITGQKPVISTWEPSLEKMMMDEDAALGFSRNASPSGNSFSVSGVRWQFLDLAPRAMGQPRPRSRDPEQVAMTEDGANLAEIVLQLRERSPDTLQGVIETVAGILGYGRDLQPVASSAVERTLHLKLVEGDFEVPGWLLSSGTLRLVALLCLLRDPSPPSLIVIEELENGLDPRTVALVIDEIRRAVETERTQVIATTHSPYLLDLVRLEHLLLVQRNAKGEPEFIRPADDQEVVAWAEKFAPGQLYKMSRLRPDA
ncbi:MAG: AAA family ATPase [Opitutaceae bacterium]